MKHIAHTACACRCCCSSARVRTVSCCLVGVVLLAARVLCRCCVARRYVAVPEAGARFCAIEQHDKAILATRMIAATMRRAGAGAVAPQPAPRLVWGWLARERRGIMGMLVRRQLVLRNPAEKPDRSRRHAHRCGSGGAHRAAAAASSTRPQRGRTAAAAAAPAAIARCSRGRRSAVAGKGSCGGAACCGGGLAARPRMSATR